MDGLMQEEALIVSGILSYAERWHPTVEVVSHTADGSLHRYRYADLGRRARQLASALQSLGIEVGAGQRVATLAWNGYRHLEAYYAIAGVGAVLHTVNPRLFPAQLEYIINHGEASVVFVDLSFLPVLEGLAAQLPSVQHYVLMSDRANMPSTSLPGALCYEEFIESGRQDFEWPELDERSASALCYTSGTTGNPKGVLYSHRSMVLHAYASLSSNSIGLSVNDTALVVVPQFHVFAWGTSFSALMAGSKIVYPGQAMDGASVYRLLQEEQCTVSLAVPTIWMMLMQHLAEVGGELPHLERVVIGGSACPAAMISTFEQRYQVKVVHAWGMTETGPLGTATHLEPRHQQLHEEQQLAIKCKQGKPVYGVDLRIVSESGECLPHDGVAFGRLQIKGHWITSAYYAQQDQHSDCQDDWFDTGDVASIDADGYLQITDRTKDVIKSGGEWISSIELENLAVGHPEVKEAAVIAVPHPKWDERPLVIAVRTANSSLSGDDLLAYLASSVAKWQVPDAVEFVDELPHGATGKLNKLALREQYQGYQLPL